jgi:hypothetical protein
MMIITIIHFIHTAETENQQRSAEYWLRSKDVFQKYTGLNDPGLCDYRIGRTNEIFILVGNTMRYYCCQLQLSGKLRC